LVTTRVSSETQRSVARRNSQYLIKVASSLVNIHNQRTQTIIWYIPRCSWNGLRSLTQENLIIAGWPLKNIWRFRCCYRSLRRSETRVVTNQ